MKLNSSRISVRLLAERNRQIVQSISRLSTGSAVSVRPRVSSRQEVLGMKESQARTWMLPAESDLIHQIEDQSVDAKMEFVRQAIIKEREHALIAQAQKLISSGSKLSSLSLYA
jgi:hypothetical protein